MSKTQNDVDWAYHYGAKSAYLKALRIVQIKMRQGPTAVEEALKKAAAIEDTKLNEIMDREDY